jgi:protoheme IX farnesyltransferase
MFRDYYKLAKPGIIYGNILTTIAAFLFAARWHFTLPLLGTFVATIFGLSCVIGSACVFNNYLDRNIDKKMERTSNRALVTGTISVRNALIYGAILGLVGIFLLYFHVNALSAALGAFGFLTYVFVYGFVKRKSDWGAVIGSVPGAVPIVVGYTAVTNHLDPVAWILFAVLVAWQMPHFYSIAVFRLEEYKAAGIPVLPATKGIKRTKLHIIFFVAAFVIAASLLFSLGYADYVYLIIMMGVGWAWFWKSLKGFDTKSKSENQNLITDEKWARSLFFFSLIVLLVFCAMISIAPLLPYSYV